MPFPDCSSFQKYFIICHTIFWLRPSNVSHLCEDESWFSDQLSGEHSGNKMASRCKGPDLKYTWFSFHHHLPLTATLCKVDRSTMVWHVLTVQRCSLWCTHHIDTRAHNTALTRSNEWWVLSHVMFWHKMALLQLLVEAMFTILDTSK